MNFQGLFSFALVLLFAAILFTLNGQSNHLGTGLSYAKQIALEIENDSFRRSELEQNLGFLIERTVEMESMKPSFSASKLKEKLAANIASFFASVEESSRNDLLVSFRLVETASGRPMEVMKSKNRKKLAGEDLAEQLAVSVLPITQHEKTVEVSFTGGLLKNRLVAGEIGSGNFTQFYVIPVNYSKTFTVVSP
ncbi:MAG: hypothetical protein V1494_06670 [Candidatus Diapherotrites archaeon]